MAVVNLLNLPLMFASNTFFPISRMPEWLQSVAKINPLTYTNDAIRQLMICGNLDLAQLVFDFTYLGIFGIVFSSIGIVLSWKYLSK